MALNQVSFSAMNLFDACALSYKAQRLDKVKQPPAELLIIGIVLHDVAEAIVRWCEENEATSIPYDMVPDFVQNAFVNNEQVKNTANFSNVMIGAKMFARGYRHEPGTIIELEQWVEAIIDPNMPKLVGRLDRVTREYDSVGEFIGNTDLKTGWSTEQKEQHRFQLDLQTLLLKLTYPDERVKSRNFFVRSGQATEWFEPKGYDLDNARRRALAIYNRMENAYKKRAYPATPGEHCAYCPIAVRCEELLGLRESGHAVITLEDAQHATIEALVLYAAYTTRQKALKKFVDANGPVIATREDPERGVLEKVEASYRLGADSVTLTDLVVAYERIGDELFDLLGAPLKTKLKKYENDSRLTGLWGMKPGKRSFRIGKLSEESEE